MVVKTLQSSFIYHFAISEFLKGSLLILTRFNGLRRRLPGGVFSAGERRSSAGADEIVSFVSAARNSGNSKKTLIGR
jgi:hypothetical protein